MKADFPLQQKCVNVVKQHWSDNFVRVIDVSKVFQVLFQFHKHNRELSCSCLYCCYELSKEGCPSQLHTCLQVVLVKSP